MTATRSRLFAPAGLLLLAGCSLPSSPPVNSLAACEPTSPTESASLPDAADIEALVRSNNVIFTGADVAGTTELLAVDTGAPITLLDPVAFPRAPPNGTVCSFDVGGETLNDEPVVTLATGFTSPDPGIPVGGLLGCPAFCDTTASFNYRDILFTLGDTTPPSSLEPATTLDFSLKGGGTASLGTAGSVSYPPSRIVVTVQIEGTDHLMIVDTGASAVVVDQATFSDLTKDGRKQIADMADTTSGVSNIAKTRAASITLGGVEVASPIVAHDMSFDANIAALDQDTGMPIVGSLGGTFLANFFLSVDYPNETLTLARYSDTSFLIDLGRSVGIATLVHLGAGYAVGDLYPGTDAVAKGVHVNDEILAIDGQELAPLSASAATLLLYGTVGATKQVQFGTAATLSNQTVPLLVEELLPLP